MTEPDWTLINLFCRTPENFAASPHLVEVRRRHRSKLRTRYFECSLKLSGVELRQQNEVRASVLSGWGVSMYHSMAWNNRKDRTRSRKTTSAKPFAWHSHRSSQPNCRLSSRQLTYNDSNVNVERLGLTRSKNIQKNDRSKMFEGHAMSVEGASKNKRGVRVDGVPVLRTSLMLLICCESYRILERSKNQRHKYFLMRMKLVLARAQSGANII